MVPQHPRLSTRQARERRHRLPPARREGLGQARAQRAPRGPLWMSRGLGPETAKTALCKTRLSGPSRLPDDGWPRQAGSQACRKPSVSSSSVPGLDRGAHPAGLRLCPAPWGGCGPPLVGEDCDSSAGQLGLLLGRSGREAPTDRAFRGGAPSRTSQTIARGHGEEWVRKTLKAAFTAHTGRRAQAGASPSSYLALQDRPEVVGDQEGPHRGDRAGDTVCPHSCHFPWEPEASPQLIMSPGTPHTLGPHAPEPRHS